MKEMLDPGRGLFFSKDGGRTLQPNSHSGVLEPDHLAYFALLGRITGLALYHREAVCLGLHRRVLCAASKSFERLQYD